MGSRSRLLAVAAVLTIGAVVAFATTKDDPARPRPRQTAAPSPAAGCLEVPARIATPSWYPADLPMPDGSFATEIPEATSGLRRVVFAASGSLRDFVRHALTVWPQQGWTLGKGESEPGEAEDNFLKGDRYGIFRAQTVYCDANTTWVLMVLSDPAASPTATPSFNRKQPGVTPSPLSS